MQQKEIQNLKFKKIHFIHNEGTYKLTASEFIDYIFNISKNNAKFITEYLNMDSDNYIKEHLNTTDINKIAKNYNVHIKKIKYNILCDNNIHFYQEELLDKQCLIPDHYHCVNCSKLKYVNTRLLDEKELKKPTYNLKDRFKHLRIKLKLKLDSKHLRLY